MLHLILGTLTPYLDPIDKTWSRYRKLKLKAPARQCTTRLVLKISFKAVSLALGSVLRSKDHMNYCCNTILLVCITHPYVTSLRNLHVGSADPHFRVVLFDRYLKVGHRVYGKVGWAIGEAEGKTGVGVGVGVGVGRR